MVKKPTRVHTHMPSDTKEIRYALCECSRCHSIARWRPDCQFFAPVGEPLLCVPCLVFVTGSREAAERLIAGTMAAN